MLLRFAFACLLVFATHAHAVESAECQDSVAVARARAMTDAEPFPFKTIMAVLIAETDELATAYKDEKRPEYIQIREEQIALRREVIARLKESDRIHSWSAFEKWDDIGAEALKYHREFVYELKADLKRRGFSSLEEAAEKLPKLPDEKQPKNSLELARNVYERIYGVSYIEKKSDHNFMGLIRYRQLFDFIGDLTFFHRSITQPDSFWILGTINEYVTENWKD